MNPDSKEKLEVTVDRVLSQSREEILRMVEESYAEVGDGPIIDEAMELLRKELGDAIEGCSLLESVALLVSQRENARNAHAATQERCEKLEAVLRVLLSPDTQIEWSHQVSVAIADGESLLKEVK